MATGNKTYFNNIQSDYLKQLPKIDFPILAFTSKPGPSSLQRSLCVKRNS